MELRHLRYFVAVADELSFRGAARKLHVAQPSLGRQIRDLEDEVGERLFDRDRRQVALTDSGRVLYGEALALLGAAEQALEHTREAARGSRGLLRIGNISRLSSSFLSRGLHAFRQLYPRVEIELVELAADDQRDALKSGAIEVGLQPADREAALDSDFSAQPILRSPIVALLRSTHPLAAEKSVSLASLRDDRFLHFQSSRPRSGYERFVGALCRDFGGFAPRFAGPVVDNAETVFGLVAADQGVVLLPKVVVRRPAAGDGWIARPLRAPVPHFELSAVWRTDNPSLILKNYLRVLAKKTTTRAS